MITITRHFEFEAAHYLPNHLGKCKNLHGHSYKLDVTVKGSINEDVESAEFGMLIDFSILDSIVKEVLEEYDHHYINKDVPIPYPTAENMVIDLSKKIAKNLVKYGYTKLDLYQCNLWENSKSYATYRNGV